MKLSVVIAAYNEEENVQELTLRLIKTLKSVKVPFEILYVVEGEDNTVNILKNLQKKHKNLRYLYSPEPLGLGRAFKKGFLNINNRATHIFTLDSDLNHQPEEMPSFLGKMKEKNADIVIGSRYVRGGSINTFPLFKRIISKFTNILVFLFTGVKIKDKTSNYRLYTRRSIDKISRKLSFPGFESIVEMLLIAKKNKFRMTETPIKFKWRIHGESKLRLFKTGLGYFRLFLRILNIKL